MEIYLKMLDFLKKWDQSSRLLRNTQSSTDSTDSFDSFLLSTPVKDIYIYIYISIYIYVFMTIFRVN